MVDANSTKLDQLLVQQGGGLLHVQGQAGKRRQWARREEEKARWDREAQ